MDLLSLLVAVLVIPTAVYFSVSRSKDVWGLVKKGEVTAGPGLYRAAPATVWTYGKAPLAVRIAAYTSFVLGQMIVPGALAALGGFIVLLEMLGRSNGRVSVALMVILASAPTGLIVAARLLGAGVAILRRAPDAVEQARRAAKWELWHNGVLFAGLVISAMVGDHEEQAGCAMVTIPVVLATIHGVLLLHAARELEAYNAVQGAEPEAGLGEGFAPVVR